MPSQRSGARVVPILLMAVLSLTACAGASAPKTPAIAGIQVFKPDPRDRHTTKRVTYLQTPPAGGPHWPAKDRDVLGWLRCGVYTEPVPNEFAVHSQEHGAVWLTYLPSATPAQVTAFAALAALSRDYVIVSPYLGQPAGFTASTWGVQLTVPDPADPRLTSFVKTYAAGGQGGEKGADCAHGSLPADERAALDAANRSP